MNNWSVPNIHIYVHMHTQSPAAVQLCVSDHHIHIPSLCSSTLSKNLRERFNCSQRHKHREKECGFFIFLYLNVYMCMYVFFSCVRAHLCERVSERERKKVWKKYQYDSYFVLWKNCCFHLNAARTFLRNDRQSESV